MPSNRLVVFQQNKIVSPSLDHAAIGAIKSGSRTIVCSFVCLFDLCHDERKLEIVRAYVRVQCVAIGRKAKKQKKKSNFDMRL